MTSPAQGAQLSAAAERAARAYGFGAGATLEPLPGGLINATFLCRDGSRAIVLQRLHPVFSPEVNTDIEAVTAHLAAEGLDTPCLVRASDGARWVEIDGAVWRALTHVEGVTLHRVPDPRWAEAAGALVGRFHRALDSLAHDYASVRVGVHDTAAHLAKLEARLAAAASAAPTAALEPALARQSGTRREAVSLGRDILTHAEGLPPLGELRPRHTHGDLKISNVLFAVRTPGKPVRARCLIDLDTLGRQTLAYELGDALRSWCNPHGEDVAAPRFDRAIFQAALRGYEAAAPGFLSDAERAALLPGVETVCVELAARFCVDVFDDAYFGWDPARYRSRPAHNLVRARGQLALARSVAEIRRAHPHG